MLINPPGTDMRSRVSPDRRRHLVRLLAACSFASPIASLAQKKPSRIHRIGILYGASPATTAQADEVFKQQLRELGFVEGENVIVERRYGEGKAQQIADFAAELVRLKMDVIVTGNDPTIAAVKRETQTIPIVMANSSDPVGTGFVASLARPGGNITGLSTMSPELSGKRLELLGEVVPGLSRVAIVWNPDVRGALFDYRETETVARTRRLQLHSIEVTRAEDLERAFATITKQRAQGVIVQTPNPVLFVNPAHIARLALTDRLPSIFGQVEFANAGGLMSYGSNTTERYRQAAQFVAKILKGTNPADLPVEQPTRFELVVNMKTAKALGITIPQSVLVRADKIIQ
jgi:putative ABC transport system substrate-binding protein